MENREKVAFLYQYFYRIVSNNRSFRYSPKQRESKMIDNFLSMLTPSHGDDWMFEYFAYQFQRYDSMETSMGKGKVMLGWVIGKKALDHFRNASEEQRFWGEKFVSENRIKNPFRYPLKVNLSDNNDRERLRFYGTDRGILHCMELELYDKKNKNCFLCRNKKDCEEIWR